jgi:hypothetical protein
MVILLRVLMMCIQLLTIKTYHVMKYKLVPHTWIDPLVWAQDRVRWQALVNAVLKFGFHKMGKFLDYPKTG